MEKTAIEFIGVNKTFVLSRKQQKINVTKERHVRAARDLSFVVPSNVIFGLLGPNGAGKTTALRMLATLIKPDSGRILVNGIEVSNEAAVKRQIAFLTNDLRLDESFTPSYLFDFFSAMHQVDPLVARERKRSLFERFGIDKFAEVKVKDLSQGMRQKVNIAISLASDPPIIIFDEPTNGLDIITARAVTDYLVDMKNQGKTIILSTHIMSLIEKICDRVAIIIDGQAVLTEDVEQLLAQHEDIDQLFFDLYVRYGRPQ